MIINLCQVSIGSHRELTMVTCVQTIKWPLSKIFQKSTCQRSLIVLLMFSVYVGGFIYFSLLPIISDSLIRTLTHIVYKCILLFEREPRTAMFCFCRERTGCKTNSKQTSVRLCTKIIYLDSPRAILKKMLVLEDICLKVFANAGGGGEGGEGRKEEGGRRKLVRERSKRFLI